MQASNAVEVEGRREVVRVASGPTLAVDVWTDRGERAVYYPGEKIKVYFKVNEDAYVVLYDVDTEGRVRLIYPLDPYSDGWVRGGTTYRLPPHDSHWNLNVSGPSGIDYIVAVASTEPFLWNEYEEDFASTVFETIDTDPQIGIERINQLIAPLRDGSPYFVSDRTMFYVERRVPYPRYVCYDCHSSWYWDPYYDICPAFEIVIYSAYYDYYRPPPYNPWGRRPYYWYKRKTTTPYPKVRYKYKSGGDSYWDGRTKYVAEESGVAKFKKRSVKRDPDTENKDREEQNRRRDVTDERERVFDEYEETSRRDKDRDDRSESRDREKEVKERRQKEPTRDREKPQSDSRRDKDVKERDQKKPSSDRENSVNSATQRQTRPLYREKKNKEPASSESSRSRESSDGNRENSRGTTNQSGETSSGRHRDK